MKDEHTFPARTKICLLSLKEGGEGHIKLSFKKQHVQGEQIPRANAMQLGIFGWSWRSGFHLKVMDFFCLIFTRHQVS